MTSFSLLFILLESIQSAYVYNLISTIYFSLEIYEITNGNGITFYWYVIGQKSTYKMDT